MDHGRFLGAAQTGGEPDLAAVARLEAAAADKPHSVTVDRSVVHFASLRVDSQVI